MKSIAGAAAGFAILVASPVAAASTAILASPIHAVAAVTGEVTDQTESDEGGDNLTGTNPAAEGENQDSAISTYRYGDTIGEGTTTPELPSGVLVAVGLVPLLTAAAILRRRGWRLISK